jgi:hypothetical protein
MRSDGMWYPACRWLSVHTTTIIVELSLCRAVTQILLRSLQTAISRVQHVESQEVDLSIR